MVWSLAYATRLGKAVAGNISFSGTTSESLVCLYQLFFLTGEAYMCVLWSYRRLHCWTDSLIEFDGFAQETQEFEGRLRGNNRALLSLA
ncbi:hypothetical protein YC2023_114807 [Brassica napus]